MKIVDMHCDTISALYAMERGGHPAALYENELHVDLCRMNEAGYLLQNFALFVNQRKCEDVTDLAWKMYDLYKRELDRNVDILAPMTCYADLERNQQEGKMSAMLTLEEGAILKGSRKILQEFFDAGVRMITLTWNYPNELGFPAAGDTIGDIACGAVNGALETGQGLTECGRDMVEAMEDLGVIVDVSHLSDAGFYDVARCAKKPFVASHSNARAVCAAKRNMTDDMIRTLGLHGGVMGLNFYPDFLGEKTPGRLSDVVTHAKHIVNVGGIDVLGLGSDFDGIEGNVELPGAQAMPLLQDALLKGGFKSSEVDKIMEGNVLRVYREVLK